MKLDDAQKKTVSAWIAEGLKLADIQRRLAAEFGINLTYMEVRFLVDDLKLMPKDPPAPKADKPAGGEPAPKLGGPLSPTEAASLENELPPAAAGNVSVTVDTVARPGALVSGSVQFSDGQSAAWYLDQMGRLGVAPRQQGYKPSAADLQAFQQGLEAELSKLGL